MQKIFLLNFALYKKEGYILTLIRLFTVRRGNA